jgi:hypothetical protein
MPVYLVISAEEPQRAELLLGSSRPLLRTGTAYDVAKLLLREGGGAAKHDRAWSVIRANEVEASAAEALGAQVRDQIAARGQLVISLGDLQIPTNALFDIASATDTIVYIAAVFEPDPNCTTWQEPVDVRPPR